jgi:hypothetical protein
MPVFVHFYCATHLVPNGPNASDRPSSRSPRPSRAHCHERICVRPARVARSHRDTPVQMCPPGLTSAPHPVRPSTTLGYLTSRKLRWDSKLLSFVHSHLPALSPPVFHPPTSTYGYRTQIHCTWRKAGRRAAYPLTHSRMRVDLEIARSD